MTRVKEGDQGISAEDIYNAICSGKSAMVVSKTLTEGHGRKGGGGLGRNNAGWP